MKKNPLPDWRRTLIKLLFRDLYQSLKATWASETDKTERARLAKVMKKVREAKEAFKR